MTDQEEIKSAYTERSRDRIYRFLTKGNSARGFLVRGNRIPKQLKKQHNLDPLETLLLGQASLGALLMAANLKDDPKIRVQWDCSGPAQNISAEADTHGAVRGYIDKISIPPDCDTRTLNLFGEGFITVTRGSRTSSTAVRYGKIAQDLTAWHMESEQAATAMALSVAFTPDGQPRGAGGLFIQAMPDAGSGIDALEQALKQLPSLGEAFAEDQDAETLISSLFKGSKILDSKRVEFFCPCSSQRYEAYLKGLPEHDRKEIKTKGPFPLEITCRNCSSVYRYSREDIQRILSQ